jgi:lipoate-protein ligase A
MYVLDLTLPTPEANLALDEALLLDAEAGRLGEGLRFWEAPSYAVVLGAACPLAAEVDEAACAREQVPILRRCSGGGTVLLGPGCLAFSLVLSMEPLALRDVTHSYVYILERLRRTLLPAVPDLVLAGTSDLAVGGLKVSGNSQRRMRSHLLHHGTLLYGFDTSRVQKHLHLPARAPAYRANRRHTDFLTNLPLSQLALKQALQTAWGANGELADWPSDRTNELVARKYANPAWIRRRQ